MKNSTILLIAAVLILGWFGSEVFTSQNICATTCISLVGMTVWEQALAVAILPALLLVGSVKLMRDERSKNKKASQVSSDHRDQGKGSDDSSV